jgi:tyrosine-protein kinase Etk/Wzc
MRAPAGETIDLGNAARSLRRGWRVILGSIALFGVLAAILIAFGPRRFSATASVVVRQSSNVGGGLLARAAGDLTGGGPGGSSGGGAIAGGVSALLGGGGSPLETEIQILESESVLGAVIDSLRLQAELRAPTGVPSAAVVREVRLAPAFRRLDLDFERADQRSLRVTGRGVDTTVAPGGTIVTPVGTLTLREAVPTHFTIRLLDREDALKRVARNLTVKKGGGEVLKVSFFARDSITAAAVPNVALAEYLARKRTSDRGVNAHRAEFLGLQIDSLGRQLAQAERALRLFQQRSGLVDAETVGKLELEQMSALRKELGDVEVEAVALDQLLAQINAGQMSARQLVGFPSFLRSSGINDLLQRLSALETDRTRMLERRMEADPEVIALSTSITNVEAQLLPLARSYQTSLATQRAEINAQLSTMGSRLGSFPAAAEEGARLVRDVKRLSATQIALQTQYVQAQLNTVAEGGDVRGLDAARVPRSVAFPDPELTAAAGLGAGLLVGIVLALFGSSHGRYFEDQFAIERALGVPALRFDPRTPLLMSGRAAVRTVLLIPVERGVETARVAERLADTALARGETATVLDLTASATPAPIGLSVGSLIARLEQDHALVIVRLSGLETDSTAAALSDTRAVLLVAPSRRVSRRDLVASLETLRRLEVPIAGVVMSDGDRRDAIAS